MVEGLAGSQSQLGVVFKPPCQHSRWEETGIPGENPRLSVRVLTNSSHECPQQESNPQSQRCKVLSRLYHHHIIIERPPVDLTFHLIAGERLSLGILD